MVSRLPSTAKIFSVRVPSHAVTVEHSIEVRLIYELYRQVEKGIIIVDPDMQRGYIWDLFKASLFIDSLYRGYPVHMIILARVDKNTFTVVDGVQRLMTIRKFFNDELRLPRIDVLHPDIRGRTFSRLSEEVRNKFMNIISVPVCYIDVKDVGTSDRIIALCDMLRRINIGEQKMTTTQILLCSFKTPSIVMVKSIARYEKYRNMMKFTDVEEKRLLDSLLVLLLSLMTYHGKPLLLHGASFVRNLNVLSSFINESDSEKLENVKREVVKLIDAAVDVGLERSHFTYAHYGIVKVKKSPINRGIFLTIMYTLYRLLHEEDIDKLKKTFIDRVEKFFRSLSESDRIAMKYEIDKMSNDEKLIEIAEKLINYVRT